MCTMAEKLDVVIFGATGFTGKYTVKEMNKILKEKPLKWGIAGRSKRKLKEVLQNLKDTTGDDFSNVKIIIADIKDEESLQKMTEQTRVIVNCCGPYRFFGEPVIKACIATGTHHVDVSAEPQYMEKMQLEYHKAAQEKGVYIIGACGFDCVPSDLGVVYLQQLFDGSVNEVEIYLEIIDSLNIGNARFNYGTLESAVYVLAHYNELRPLRQNLYPERLPEFKPKQKSKAYVHKNPIVNDKWAVPFPAADRSVVTRSQRHFYDHDKKRPAQVQTYMSVPSLLSVLVIGFFGLLFLILSKFSFGRRLLLTFPRLFTVGWCSHEGPSEELLDITKFSVVIVGHGWSKTSDQRTEPPNKTRIVRVSSVNPYSATSVMLLMCSLTILNEADKMPDNGGVYPPGAAFAKTSLVQELNKNGITFELVSSKDE